ncbi:MAG: 5'/3'-nucleotidase SurE [Anaerolineales bacterium]|nr:5'/3'-nucleotidase SurE [Anaerolineales bacterium]
MKILLSNDDGVNAEGLKVLVKRLKEMGDVVVVAPDREQSAVGTSMTVRLPIKLHEAAPLAKGVPTYSVEGTPADAVILALEWICKGEIDLVVSGINTGLNLGYDVLLSGTVSAARNAFIRGIPAIALSVEGLQGNHFEGAIRTGEVLVEQFAQGKLPKDIFLNVNMPNINVKDIKGARPTRLGELSYIEGVREDNLIGKSGYFWITRPQAAWDLSEGTDMWAINQNMISITALNANLTTAINHADTLQRLSDLLYQQLGK